MNEYRIFKELKSEQELQQLTQKFKDIHKRVDVYFTHATANVNYGLKLREVQLQNKQVMGDLLEVKAIVDGIWKKTVQCEIKVRFCIDNANQIKIALTEITKKLISLKKKGLDSLIIELATHDYRPVVIIKQQDKFNNKKSAEERCLCQLISDNKQIHILSLSIENHKQQHIDQKMEEWQKQYDITVRMVGSYPEFVKLFIQQ